MKRIKLFATLAVSLGVSFIVGAEAAHALGTVTVQGAIRDTRGEYYDWTAPSPSGITVQLIHVNTTTHTITPYDTVLDYGPFVVEKGFFSVSVTPVVALAPMAVDPTNWFIQISGILSPLQTSSANYRIPVNAVPFALVASSLANNSLTNDAVADGTLSGAKIAPGTLSSGAISGTIPLTKLAAGSASSGQVLTWNGSAWAPAAPTNGSNGGNVVASQVSSEHLVVTPTSGISGSSQYVAGDGTNSVSLRAPSTLTGSYSLVFPTMAPTNGQVLASDTSGNLSWISPSTGSVTSVNVSAPLTATGTSSPTISIPQANGSQNGYLASSDWTAFNNKISASLPNGSIWMGNGSDVATAVTPSGDVTFTNAGVASVEKIRNIAVSATAPNAAGQVLRYDGTSQWISGFLSLADIRSTVLSGNTIFPSSSCAASQALTWSSLIDTFTCSNIVISSSQVTFDSQAANRFLASPDGAAGTPTFRSLTANDLPSNAYDARYVRNGANSISSTAALTIATGGSNNDLTLTSTGTTGDIVLNPGTSSGRVSVNGEINLSGQMNSGSSINAGTTLKAGTSTTSPIVYGSASTNGSLILESTSDSSKGTVYLNPTNGNVGVGMASNATARLHLAAGTATAGTAPLKLTSGTNLTTAEAGAIEYNGTFTMSPSAGTRRTVAFTDGGQAFTSVGNITGAGALTLASGGTNTNITLSPIGTGFTTTARPFTITDNATTTSSTTGALRVTGGISTASALWAGTTATAPIFYGGSSSSGNVTLDSTSNATKGFILLGPNGGRVGIGTSSPSVALDVSGAIKTTGGITFSDGTTMTTALAGGTSGNTSIVDLNMAADTDTNGSGVMTFATNGNERMRIENGGNIGIATTVPTARLHLPASTTAASTAPLKFTAGVLNSTAESGAFEFDGSLLYFTAIAGTRRRIPLFDTAGNYTGTGATTIAAGGSNQNLTLSATGTGFVTTSFPLNVTSSSASTSTTTGALRVTGGVGVGGAIFTGSTLSVATNTTSPIYYGSSVASGTLTLDSNSTATKGHVLMNPTGGRVGIGTSSPVATLDVKGHLANTGANATVAACGSGASIDGNDTRGTITIGTGSVTSCTITFNSAYSPAPYCVVSWKGTPGSAQIGVNATVSDMTISFSASSPSTSVNYICMQ